MAIFSRRHLSEFEGIIADNIQSRKANCFYYSDIIDKAGPQLASKPLTLD